MKYKIWRHMNNFKEKDTANIWYAMYAIITRKKEIQCWLELAMFFRVKVFCSDMFLFMSDVGLFFRIGLKIII